MILCIILGLCIYPLGNIENLVGLYLCLEICLYRLNLELKIWLRAAQRRGQISIFFFFFFFFILTFVFFSSFPLLSLSFSFPSSPKDLPNNGGTPKEITMIVLCFFEKDIFMSFLIKMLILVAKF